MLSPVPAGCCGSGWHIHVVNPPKWGRISRERGFANAARACWQNEKFDIVQSHERIAGCDIFGRGRCAPPLAVTAGAGTASLAGETAVCLAVPPLCDEGGAGDVP